MLFKRNWEFKINRVIKVWSAANGYYHFTISSECEVSLTSQLVTCITVTTARQREISSSVSFIHCNKSSEFSYDSTLSHHEHCVLSCHILAPQWNHMVTLQWPTFGDSTLANIITSHNITVTSHCNSVTVDVTSRDVIVKSLLHFSNRSVTSHSNYNCSIKKFNN